MDPFELGAQASAGGSAFEAMGMGPFGLPMRPQTTAKGLGGDETEDVGGTTEEGPDCGAMEADLNAGGDEDWACVLVGEECTCYENVNVWGEQPPGPGIVPVPVPIPDPPLPPPPEPPDLPTSDTHLIPKTLLPPYCPEKSKNREVSLINNRPCYRDCVMTWDLFYDEVKDVYSCYVTSEACGPWVCRAALNFWQGFG